MSTDPHTQRVLDLASQKGLLRASDLDAVDAPLFGDRRMNNFAASVRARLLNVAKTQGVNFNQVLVHFALERILYRLSQSEYTDHFLLKGVSARNHRCAS